MDDYLKRNKEMAREMENWSKKNPGKSSADFWNLKPKKEAKSAKSKALERKVKAFGRSLKKENVSYGELAEMSHPKYKKHLMSDPRLAEAAGISESEYNKYHKKNNHARFP